jgi:peptide/histidine transporter 3/4
MKFDIHKIFSYLFSCSYDQALVCLTLSATLPQLKPPPCAANQACQEANSREIAILYFSLVMAAIGSGGIRPCVAAFGVDQFVGLEPKHKSKTWVFFNWYYFVMGASMLLSSTVLVYIQDNVGWGWGLGVPTAAMLFSISIFVLGYPLYRILDPAGSPFTRLLQVTVAAFRKRKVPFVSDPKMLYQNKEIDASISAEGMLNRTKQFQ